MAAMSSQRKGLLAAMWVVSVVLAFAVGTQFSFEPKQPGPAATAAPTAAAPTATAAAPTQAAPSPDPSASAELEQYLLELPRRQADDPLALGEVDATVVLTNWSDYRCPFCARWHETTFPELQRFVDDGTLRIEFRDLVLFGEESTNAAIAARAAGQQGKFWEYQEAVFSSAPESGHPEIDRATLLKFATQAGVADLGAFEAALDDPALAQAVEADTREAQQMGIGGTPFFVVGAQVINGAQPLETFVQAIEAQAKR